MASSNDPQPSILARDLPVPVDDGAAAHLPGRAIPQLRLHSTQGPEVDIAQLAADGLVLYVFPGMGPPGRADPPGWNDIPGARGCTQQSCAFRDRHQEFSDLGYVVAGVSAQGRDEQQEASQRLHLSFPLLADPERRLGQLLNLPTFDIDETMFYKRLTLIARGGRIVKVFYPVFPPDQNAEEVLGSIRSNPVNR